MWETDVSLSILAPHERSVMPFPSYRIEKKKQKPTNYPSQLEHFDARSSCLSYSALPV